MERNLRRAMSISDGDWSILIASPISIGLYILTAGFLALSVWLAVRDHKQTQAERLTEG
jgi:putative tricarboxylic transport membrane protein